MRIRNEFHDIIELDRPELAINELNQAYFTELKVEGFTFESTDLYP